MRRNQRLTKQSDFATVYRRGRAFAHPLLALRLLPNQLPHSRYGFAVGKTVGKAVVRNQVKRRLREGVHTLPVQSGWDIVVIARSRAAAADFHALRRATARLLTRAGVLTSVPPDGQVGAADLETGNE
jgi:ribonuclease P protein component